MKTTEKRIRMYAIGIILLGAFTVSRLMFFEDWVLALIMMILGITLTLYKLIRFLKR